MGPARNHRGRSRIFPRIVTVAVWMAMGMGALYAPTAYGADANELFGLGPIQKSMGGAGAANPKDSTWALLNPASLVDLGRRIDVNAEWLRNRVSAHSQGFVLLSNPFAGDQAFYNNIVIPSFGVVWPLENATLGFGLFGVEGNRTDFDHPRATVALPMNGDRRAGHQVARIPIAYAHRFGEGWAVGAAFVPAFTRFRTDSLTLSLQPTVGRNHWDSAQGCGFELGVYRNWDKWAFGASYTSRTKMRDYSAYKHDLVLWTLDLPQKVQVGIAHRPTENLELALDYKWLDWDDIPLLGRETIHGGLGWRSQHVLKGGVSWNVNDRWTLRGGLSYANAAVTSEYVFANALTPALARIHAACGFSHKINDHSSIHVTYSLALPEDQTDNGNGDIFSHLGKGTEVTYQEYSLSAQYSYEF